MDQRHCPDTVLRRGDDPFYFRITGLSHLEVDQADDDLEIVIYAVVDFSEEQDFFLQRRLDRSFCFFPVGYVPPCRMDYLLIVDRDCRQ